MKQNEMDKYAQNANDFLKRTKQLVENVWKKGYVVYGFATKNAAYLYEQF